MKIFIAGARAITHFDDIVKTKLLSIYEKGFNVLVGDAAGVDSVVQKFYADRLYQNVTVFASNGTARNNIGNWAVEHVSVENGVKGFNFYEKKDIAMANSADYGFMIWNGESKGTLNNIINLIKQGKTCCVYLTTHKQIFVIDSNEKLTDLLSLCPDSVADTYSKLTKTKLAHFAQVAMF